MIKEIVFFLLLFIFLGCSGDKCEDVACINPHINPCLNGICECELQGISFVKWSLTCSRCTEEQERGIAVEIEGIDYGIVKATRSSRLSRIIEVKAVGRVSFKLRSPGSPRVIKTGTIHLTQCEVVEDDRIIDDF